MTKINEISQKIKRPPIRDLSSLPGEFLTAAEPLTRMLGDRLQRLETANDKSLPYILQDIQLLSEGLTNLEALYGALCEMYCELGDKCLFLENQWEGSSNVLQSLKDALHQTKVEAWEMRNKIDQFQNHG